MKRKELESNNFGARREVADWTRDTPWKYLKKVRYNPLEELRVEKLRDGKRRNGGKNGG